MTPTPEIISLDPYVFGFIKANLGTLTLLLGLLKGLALMTPSTTDDKVVTMIQNLLIPKPKETTDEPKTV